MYKTLIIITLLSSLVTTASWAVCPVCSFVVGAGIGLTQYLNIDDLITGLWIGSLMVSLIIATINLLQRFNWRFPADNLIVAIVYYLQLYFILKLSQLIGHPLNKWLGYDKLLLGIGTGSLLFIIGLLSNAGLKRLNNQKSFFPFQKVLVPLIPLLLVSVIIYCNL